jgi:hypothetical protein
MKRASVQRHSFATINPQPSEQRRGRSESELNSAIIENAALRWTRILSVDSQVRMSEDEFRGNRSDVK